MYGYTFAHKRLYKMGFFIDDPSCQIYPFEDLFRALGKRPLLKRKPKLASTLCSLSQSYNELHISGTSP